MAKSVLERRVNRIIICIRYDLSLLPLMNFCIPGSWYTIFAPADIFRDVLSRINAEMKRALMVTEVKDNFATLSIKACGITPEKPAVTQNDEMKRIRRLVKFGALKPE